MTKAEKIRYINSVKGETLSPRQVSLLLGGNPYSYNLAAYKSQLTLPHFLRGSYLRIFKEPIKQILLGNMKYFSMFKM